MPAEFRFSLQPLLDRRRRLEEEKEHAYVALWSEINTNLRDIARLNEALREGTRTSRASDLAYVDAAIAAQRHRGTQLEAALERAREALTIASRERRAIEKLLERRRSTYEADCARREEIEIDEANAR
jgi:flagellar export protein FliJ